jgi:hypothetical protein
MRRVQTCLVRARICSWRRRPGRGPPARRTHALRTTSSLFLLVCFARVAGPRRRRASKRRETKRALSAGAAKLRITIDEQKIDPFGSWQIRAAATRAAQLPLAPNRRRRHNQSFDGFISAPAALVLHCFRRTNWRTSRGTLRLIIGNWSCLWAGLQALATGHLLAQAGGGALVFDGQQVVRQQHQL